MKKLLTALFTLLVTCSLRADVVFKETFSYVDGALHLVSTNTPGVTNWFRHSGTGNDSLIRGQKLQVGMIRYMLSFSYCERLAITPLSILYSRRRGIYAH